MKEINNDFSVLMEWKPDSLAKREKAVLFPKFWVEKFWEFSFMVYWFFFLMNVIPV